MTFGMFLYTFLHITKWHYTRTPGVFQQNDTMWTPWILGFTGFFPDKTDYTRAHTTGMHTCNSMHTHTKDNMYAHMQLHAQMQFHAYICMHTYNSRHTQFHDKICHEVHTWHWVWGQTHTLADLKVCDPGLLAIKTELNLLFRLTWFGSHWFSVRLILRKCESWESCINDWLKENFRKIGRGWKNGFCIGLINHWYNDMSVSELSS